MAKGVCCDISNCVYHENSKCCAKEVEVKSCQCDYPNNSKETQCITFKCK